MGIGDGGFGEREAGGQDLRGKLDEEGVDQKSNTTALFLKPRQLLDVLAVKAKRYLFFTEHIHSGEGDGFVLFEQKSFGYDEPRLGQVMPREGLPELESIRSSQNTPVSAAAGARRGADQPQHLFL